MSSAPQFSGLLEIDYSVKIIKRAFNRYRRDAQQMFIGFFETPMYNEQAPLGRFAEMWVKQLTDSSKYFHSPPGLAQASRLSGENLLKGDTSKGAPKQKRGRAIWHWKLCAGQQRKSNYVAATFLNDLVVYF